MIEAVKAFVPPTDPVVNTDDNDQQSNGHKVLEGQKDIPVEKNSQKKGIAKKKSSDILEAKSATISPRPTSAQSTIRVKIGSSTSEPQLVPSQNAPTRGVGFDCRSQRLAKQQEKPPDLKITLETSSQEIIFQRDEEKKIDIMTPIQRGGLQSSEELRRPKIDDDESIQWKKLTELEESKIGLSEGMMPSTLDTAIDWQHVQDISYHDEDDEDDERNSDPLYSPRCDLYDFFPHTFADTLQSPKQNLHGHLSVEKKEHLYGEFTSFQIIFSSFYAIGHFKCLLFNPFFVNQMTIFLLKK